MLLCSAAIAWTLLGACWWSLTSIAVERAPAFLFALGKEKQNNNLRATHSRRQIDKQTLVCIYYCTFVVRSIIKKGQVLSSSSRSSADRSSFADMVFRCFVALVYLFPVRLWTAAAAASERRRLFLYLATTTERLIYCVSSLVYLALPSSVFQCRDVVLGNRRTDWNARQG